MAKVAPLSAIEEEEEEEDDAEEVVSPNKKKKGSPKRVGKTVFCWRRIRRLVSQYFLMLVIFAILPWVLEWRHRLSKVVELETSKLVTIDAVGCDVEIREARSQSKLRILVDLDFGTFRQSNNGLRVRSVRGGFCELTLRVPKGVSLIGLDVTSKRHATKPSKACGARLF